MNTTNIKNVTVNKTRESGPWLLLAFIGLTIAKLAGYLNISWWLVTMPLWIIPAIILGVLAICVLIPLTFAGLIFLFEWLSKLWKK